MNTSPALALLRRLPSAVHRKADPLAGQVLADGLRVSAPSDPLEREAEATASRVMRMQAPAKAGRAPAGELQRACASCGGQKDKAVHRKPASVQRAPAAIAGQGGSGSALPEGVRADMEGRFGGQDFSGVRVHAGPQANTLARSYNARAFTMGSDIYFGQGEYSPSSKGGQHLLAHELTHVVQGGGVSGTASARAGGSASDVHRISTANQVSVQRKENAGGAARARTILVRLAALSERAFRRKVRLMSRRATQKLLRDVSDADKVRYRDLISRIRTERVVANAERLKDDLYWAGPSGPDSTGQISTHTSRPPDSGPGSEDNINDFAVWVRGGRRPTKTSKMNCWEMVLFAAWRSGAVPKRWIVRIHYKATQAYKSATVPSSSRVTAYYDALSTSLGYNSARRWSIGDAVPRGNLVFFNGLGHVAISTGRVVRGKHQVMSLWVYPMTAGGRLNSVNQRTSIEAILASAPMSVSHGPPPWQ